MKPNTIQFNGTDSTWVMRITADRCIEVNEDVEVTEAAQKVLDAMQHLLKPAQQEPDYAWPTVADYEKDMGFAVNDTFKAAWNMARTTNDLFTQMEKK